MFLVVLTASLSDEGEVVLSFELDWSDSCDAMGSEQILKVKAHTDIFTWHRQPGFRSRRCTVCLYGAECFHRRNYVHWKIVGSRPDCKGKSYPDRRTGSHTPPGMADLC